jgi:hypothetical protein
MYLVNNLGAVIGKYIRVKKGSYLEQYLNKRPIGHITAESPVPIYAEFPYKYAFHSLLWAKLIISVNRPNFHKLECALGLCPETSIYILFFFWFSGFKDFSCKNIPKIVSLLWLNLSPRGHEFKILHFALLIKFPCKCDL